MDGSTLIDEVVCHSELNGVAHVNSECWAWPLVIDSNERSSVSVRSRRNPIDAPCEASCLGSWGSNVG